MADREQRTPLYGTVLILTSMFGAFAVNYYEFGPYWFRIAVYIVAAAVILVAAVMTFRDYSH